MENEAIMRAVRDVRAAVEHRPHLEESVVRAVTQPRLRRCPFSGGACTHRATCATRPGFGYCWLRHARLASEPEGQTTGLHRDSMG